jgi:hypothetical protein
LTDFVGFLLSCEIKWADKLTDYLLRTWLLTLSRGAL